MILSESEQGLREALARMAEVARDELPIIVMEHLPSEKFVQFCGSKDEGLIFDVPAFKVTKTLWRTSGWQYLKPVLDDATAEAISGLFRQGVQLTDEVVIHEDRQRPKARYVEVE